MTAPQSVLRRFTTSFHPRSGELLVYGSFATGAFTSFLTYMSGNPIFLPVAMLCFTSTFYFQPFLDTDSAQLGADTRGLYIRKLGYIPWPVVEAFRVNRVAVRTVERVRLEIKLRDDWKDSLQCETNVPLSDRLTYRTWSKLKNNVLEVRLEHMRDGPKVIEDSIIEIWQNRPVSSDDI